MILPYIAPTGMSRDMISAFGGYNNSERCAENEAFDECNISSDLYPILSPREPRVIFKNNVINCRGLHVNNGLIEIKKDTSNNENALFYEGVKYGVLTGSHERQLVSMGAYVIIWPDKKMFDTKTKTLSDLYSSWSGSVSFQMCKMDGTTISPTVSSTAPANPSAGDYWLDTSETPNVLKVWSESQGMWNAVATSYTKMSGTGIGSAFEKMDVVKISGVAGTYADTFNTDMAIWDKTADSIIVTALISTTFSQSGISIKREPPDMDFICEHGNRIWGCSSANHEIYASKLGDPKNWKSYIGTAADSYAATVGSEGDFTGCAEQGGSVVFFKENYIHKLYGTYPANYQISTSPERGVQKGCHKSICLLGGLLYYKSVDGVCLYEGSYPRLISGQLGKGFYDNAVAGVFRDKYYIRMRQDDVYKLFVYDTTRNQWHIEDINKEYKFFVEYKRRLMMYDPEGMIIAEGRDTSIDGTTYTLVSEGPTWSRTSGTIGLSDPGKKYILQILFRMSMEIGSELWIDIMYDSSGDWEEVAHVKNEYEDFRTNTKSYTKMRTYELPIVPRRCDHMKIRLRGEGMMKLFSISKAIESGGR